MLAPVKSQSLLSKILKKAWTFDESRLNEKVIEFSQAFETNEEKDAITIMPASTATADPKNTKTNFFESLAERLL